MLESGKYRDLGLLILRLGMGGMFVTHGLPKLLGGPSKWETLGHAVGNFGIHFAPTFWGFMAAFAEGVGGLCFALGAFFAQACALLFTTMVVASTQHFVKGDGLGTASHAIEAAVVFGSLLLIGPGPYRVRIGR